MLLKAEKSQLSILIPNTQSREQAREVEGTANTRIKHENPFLLTYPLGAMRVFVRRCTITILTFYP